MGARGVNPGAPRPNAADVAELVRLPAVLSVPGDLLAGAALAGTLTKHPLRTAALVGSSSLIYLGGMALNDVADHDIDAVERPHRPIPSGRISLRTASRIAHLMILGGVALAGVAGKKSLAVAVPLAASVYAYDLTLKDHPSAPASMATCRVLDVLQGASTGRIRDALPGAAIIGTHTAMLSTVSGKEVEGADPRFATAATAASGAVATMAAATYLRPNREGNSTTKADRHSRRGSTSERASGRKRPRAKTIARHANAAQSSETNARPGRFDKLGATAIAAAYGASQLSTGSEMIKDPSPQNLQKYVGSSVMGMIPLQAATVLSRGHRVTAAILGAAWPLARALSRKKSVT